MRRLKDASAKLGDGTFLDGIKGAFPEGFWADLFAQVLMAWITGCGLPVGGRDAREMCEEAWDGSRYDRGFFRRATRTTRAESRKLGERMTSTEAKAATREALDAVRTGDDESMTEIILECQGWKR